MASVSSASAWPTSAKAALVITRLRSETARGGNAAMRSATDCASAGSRSSGTTRQARPSSWDCRAVSFSPMPQGCTQRRASYQPSPPIRGPVPSRGMPGGVRSSSARQLSKLNPLSPRGRGWGEGLGARRRVHDSAADLVANTSESSGARNTHPPESKAQPAGYRFMNRGRLSAASVCCPGHGRACSPKPSRAREPAGR